MKTLKHLKMILIAGFVLFNTNLFSAVYFQADVRNQTVVINDPAYGGVNTVYFDIYLVEQIGSSGPLYLAASVFKFNFNAAYFTNPTFEYVLGSGELYNSLGTLTSFYDAGITTAFVSPNELDINVPAVPFSTQTQFNARVAKIDGTPNKHKLGTFVVYASNLIGSFGLVWKTGTGGTCISTFLPVSPWTITTASGYYVIVPNLPLPIELTSFTGNVLNKRDVTLNWNTATETNDKGFDIERKTMSSETWSKIGYIDGKGTTTSQTSYRFEDRKLNTGKYNYRLKQKDYNGNFEYYDLNSVIEVGVPTKYDISQNYPNPFNPTTRIDFDLPFNSRVTMKLYDMSGREVMTLVNDQRTAGYYTETFNMSNLSSGAYFYRIDANGNGQNFVMSKKMLLVK